MAPTASLYNASAGITEGLGFTLGARAFAACDVTGDGQVDVVAGARNADPDGVSNAGVIYVWSDGSTLTGTPAPVVLRNPDAATLDGVNLVQCVDLTGDGILDVVGGSPFVDFTAGNSGGLYLWTGGPGLTGTVDPTAAFVETLASLDDRLGDPWTIFGDVDGDGWLDLVSAAMGADANAVVDSGAVYIWSGESSYATGFPPAMAVGTAPNARTGDGLGN